jgi:PST family polysaccharide transporter
MKFHESTVFRNFIFLFFNQFFNLIIPLLVFPFLVKTLGLELFGLYSITYAGVLYCFMFCDYGFNFSGSKYIAINRSDVLKRDRAFSTIISLRIVIAMLISAFWIVFIFCDPKFENHTLFGLLFIGMIFGNAINIQWFFQGIEQLGWYSTINSVIKLLSNVSILFIVRSPDDIYLIPLIYSAAFLLTGIITILMAVYSVKVAFRFLSFDSFRLFLKEGFDYFVTISTTSLVFNGTIIILSLFEKNILIIGVFSALDRIIKILVSIYVPYSTAIYPRNMANFQISHDHGKKSVVKYGSIALFFAFICIIMICFLSDTILFYLNPELVPFSGWLQLFSVWLFFIIANNLLGYHYMNGLNMSSVFRNINTVYTIVTVGLMLAGCYLYSFKGCIWAVLCGEIFLTAMLLYWSKAGQKRR